jgi:hypothetical protein
VGQTLAIRSQGSHLLLVGRLIQGCGERQKQVSPAPSIAGAEEAAEKLEKSDETDEKRPSAAKADIQFTGFMRGLKPPPPSAWSFSAVCKAQY